MELDMGEFIEKSKGIWFEYSLNPDPLWSEYPHKIWFIDGSWKAANITKTRAYVIISVDSEGNPLIDTWKIRNNTVFSDLAGRIERAD
jgi:hypothetical protein